MKNNKNRKEVNVEYGIDSRYGSPSEKNADSITLMQTRLDKIKHLSKQEILQARLLQLKLRMENYLKDPLLDNKNHFAKFLEIYVDLIYRKRGDFAMDMNVTANYLSKVINNHRKPKEEFILKLMIHSEKTFHFTTDFQNSTWYKIYLHEKICDTMANQDEWRCTLENQVSIANTIV